jgi:oxygen-independent coproporphyrinogen-3 oxidase
VYVHVPFCRHRCGYCAFAVHVGADSSLRRRYVEAVIAEVAAVAGTRAEWPGFGSVFVGGGTPTQLEAQELAKLLQAVQGSLPVAADAEVTVEANPEDVDERYLATLVGAGLTRLSLGAQSAAAHVLAFLDRRHAPGAVPRAVEAARAAGVASVSVDLIYGAPAESEADWRASLEAAVALGLDHVSCYALTLEPNTPYARDVRAGRKDAPDDDVAAGGMATAAEVLGAAGFHRYEVSNWARPGHESRHNLVYWAQGDYLAFGAAAHGHWDGRRWWNVRPTERYVERALAGASPIGGEEVLDARQRADERVLLGLRTAQGLARPAEGVDAAAVAELTRAGLVAGDRERIRLTSAGMALGDAVTLRLLARAPQR